MKKVLGIRTDEFEEASVEEILDYFKDHEFVEYDCETDGFCPHTKKVVCFQLGDKDRQYVVHPYYFSAFRNLLEEKTLIGHNLKFDLKFLYKQGIYPNKVYDTFLVEGVLKCGIKSAKKGLAAVAMDRLGIDLDKSVRENIWKEGLTTRVIDYSADDVRYLGEIKKDQEKEIHLKNLQKVVDLENEFVLYLAYIEYCGFKLDKKTWKEKMKVDQERLDAARNALDQYILDEKITKFINIQGNIFHNDLKVNLNWSSSRQVVQLFKELGIPTEITEKGVKKDSVDAKHINKYAKSHPIIPLYLEYKEAEKVVSTYGQSFLEQINVETGRIHTSFRQIMDTGRISSGGKNRNTGEEYVNFQNIPEESRLHFVPEPGNVLIVGDYSGQEQIVLANMCQDPALLEFYDNGYGDMHSFVASKMVPELDGVGLDVIKEHHKDSRQEAKIAGFVINYGGAPNNIADQLHKSIEDGERVFKAYFQAFPGLEKYFDKVKKEGVARGYIAISERTNRKCYIDGYQEFRDTEQKFTSSYWTTYRIEKAAFMEGRSNNFPPLKEEVSEYFKKKGELERKSLNYPIQGQSAEITKISGILFFKWIKTHGLLGIVKAVNQVHDENVVECPKAIEEIVRVALKDCMTEAGELYCQRVPLKVDPVIVQCWEK